MHIKFRIKDFILFNFLVKYRPPFIRITIVYLYFEGVILRDILQFLYTQLFHI